MSDHLAAGFALADLVPASGISDDPDREVPDRPVTVAGTLDSIVAFVRRFVAFSDAEAAAFALWVFHTHAFDAAETTPYLAISSPEKRSGKSRLLDVAELLVRRPWRAVTPSEAVTFRKIAKDTPTLLLDEADAIFGKAAREHEGLRALLNAGFRSQGSTIPRCVGDGAKMRTEDFATFCPKVIAGIGQLPDTVSDRAVTINLRRKPPEMNVERFRRREVGPKGDELRADVESIAGRSTAHLSDARPTLPDELNDRAQDVWEPLLAIADLAEGDWPHRAREAVIALSGQPEVEEETIGIRLLSDIHAIFDAQGGQRLASSEILDALYAIEEAPWADWYGKPITAGKLSVLLRPYGVKPRKTEARFRGYIRADFEDAWSRYLPSPPTTRHNRHNRHNGVVEPLFDGTTRHEKSHQGETIRHSESTSVADVEGSRGDSVALRLAENRLEQRDMADVAVVAGCGDEASESTEDVNGLIEQLSDLLKESDFPTVQLRPGVHVAAGREAWRRFSKGARDRARRGDDTGIIDLRAATKALDKA